MEERFYKGKKVFVTGHTGFKGTWLCRMLLLAGAEVTGYALKPSGHPSLFHISGVEKEMQSIIGDIRDFDFLEKVICKVKPEIVFHLAAQPIVRQSYTQPRDTYETNIMGTVNILESIRRVGSVKSLVNVTTDKVYRNREWEWGYRESDELDGYDPYSNSKSCSELVTHCYKQSFFSGKENPVAISTARAGNVLGGGDFSADRIIPDCFRAVSAGEKIRIRNPHSVRPYQHVLDALYAYMIIAKAQYNKPDMAGCYNIGPDEKDCIETGKLVELFCRKWTQRTGRSAKWDLTGNEGPHESGFLKLDCSRMKNIFLWQPVWNIDKTLDKVVEWYDGYIQEKKICNMISLQIEDFYRELENRS